jgi:hypothetical protein
VDDFKSPFGTPGKPVPRVKASDMKAVWKQGRDAAARHPGMQVATGSGMVQYVCSLGADVNAVFVRSARLGMLMMRCGKQDVQPHDILFTIFAKLPMKWWAPGVPHRGLF